MTTTTWLEYYVLFHKFLTNYNLILIVKLVVESGVGHYNPYNNDKLIYPNIYYSFYTPYF